jgi:Holliday junction resolvase RusA-like endonuclease
LDNLLKATLDGLAHAGVYEDDSQIVDLRIYWAPDIGGMLKIKIEEVE